MLRLETKFKDLCLKCISSVQTTIGEITDTVSKVNLVSAAKLQKQCIDVNPDITE